MPWYVAGAAVLLVITGGAVTYAVMLIVDAEREQRRTEALRRWPRIEL